MTEDKGCHLASRNEVRQDEELPGDTVSLFHRRACLVLYPV